MSYDQDNFEELNETPDENLYDELLEEMELNEREFWKHCWDDDIAEQLADQRLEDEKIMERGRDRFLKR